MSGDVVTFHDDEGRLTTHRVVATKTIGAKQMLGTKGDANRFADPTPVHPDDVIGRVVGHLGPFSAAVEALRPGGRWVLAPAAAAGGLVLLEVLAFGRWVVATRRARRDVVPSTGLVLVASRPRRTPLGAFARRGLVVAGVMLGTLVVRIPAMALFVDLDTAGTSTVATVELTKPVLTAVKGCELADRWVDLSWSADPVDGTKDVEYEVIRDAVVIATVTDSPYRDTVGINETHVYSLRAILGPWSSPNADDVTVTSDAVCP